MVVLNRITTRTGDDGTSGLIGGERRRKDDPRFEAIGTIDEANAAIGLARAAAEGLGPLGGMLALIQNDLFDLGADLATPGPGRKGEALRIADTQVARLEADTAALNRDLSALTTFVLPGGSPAAAALHLARAIVRRAERVLVALAHAPGEAVNPAALRYANRLSDFLFVAARWANGQAGGDLLWTPGANR